MAVSIRLARIGKKKAPFYRIVAIDSRKSRDGEYLENLGTYNPLTGELIQFHIERIQDWLSKGAIPSDTVVKLKKQFERATKSPIAASKVTKKVVKTVPKAVVEGAEKTVVIEQDQALPRE